MKRRTFFKRTIGTLAAAVLVWMQKPLAWKSKPWVMPELGRVHYVDPSIYYRTLSGQEYVKPDHSWAGLQPIHKTISDAIDACEPGDTIVVRPLDASRP